MRTKDNLRPIASSLFGKTRRAILALLFTNADKEYYLREIVRLIGGGRGAVVRELANLTDAGVIVRLQRGRQVYHRANKACPVFKELKSLLVKTVGVADVLRAALQPLNEEIEVAFVYGSFAKGTERRSSDVDLMVIGNVKHKDIVKAVASAQKELSREINPSVYTRTEFEQRLNDSNSFISRVNKSDKIMVVGDENELKFLG